MDNVLSLNEAIQNAKDFQNFSGIFTAVSLHPEWLVEIPEDRKWAILHHVIYSGNVDHLNQLLAFQQTNINFHLLTETRANETVLDVAKLRDNQTAMLQRIEQFITLDRLLNHAKECEWDECYDIVRENPTYGNEKPPYRRYYLVHHMACANEVSEFERFRQIENFKFDLTLRADRKKINVIAREADCEEFASYIEENYPTYFADDDADDQLYEPTEDAIKHTNHINALMLQRNILFESTRSLGHEEYRPTRTKVDEYVKQKQLKQQQPHQASNEDKSLINQPIDTLRAILTCSLTHAIVTDPVVAADGFTYERSAIEKWLKTNNCSPMTNEKLAHKDLNPNFVVKQILMTISQE